MCHWLQKQSACRCQIRNRTHRNKDQESHTNPSRLVSLVSQLIQINARIAYLTSECVSIRSYRPEPSAKREIHCGQHYCTCILKCDILWIRVVAHRQHRVERLMFLFTEGFRPYCYRAALEQIEHRISFGIRLLFHLSFVLDAFIEYLHLYHAPWQNDSSAMSKWIGMGPVTYPTSTRTLLL